MSTKKHRVAKDVVLIEDDSEDEILNLVSIYRDERSAYSLTSCSCRPFISNNSKNDRLGN